MVVVLTAELVTLTSVIILIVGFSKMESPLDGFPPILLSTHSACLACTFRSQSNIGNVPRDQLLASLARWVYRFLGHALWFCFV